MAKTKQYTAQEMRDMAAEAEVIEVADQFYGHNMDTIAAMLRQAADAMEREEESDVVLCRKCQTERTARSAGMMESRRLREENTMKNFERYKTSEERENAFIDFCDSYEECEDCPLIKLADSCGACLFDWLDLEAEEDENPLQERKKDGE